MRTKQLISTLLVFFLVQSISYGQGFVFRVLASKGENKVKKADGGETIALKTGATLMSGDELIASNGAYIGLMHKTGRTIEVRNSGVTKITDLESKLASSQATVANKYAQFVMNKMNEEDGDINENYQSNMKTTGAATRGFIGIKVYLPNPNAVKLLNSEATISWSKVDGENVTYIMSIKNIFDEEIFTTETTGTSVNINFEDESLSNEKLVIVNVKMKGAIESVITDYGIQRLSDEDASSITSNLEALKAEVPMDDSPLNSLIYASFYEENNLYLDAITQYEKAIKMSPDVTDFQDLYTNFLYKSEILKVEVEK